MERLKIKISKLNCNFQTFLSTQSLRCCRTLPTQASLPYPIVVELINFDWKIMKYHLANDLIQSTLAPIGRHTSRLSSARTLFGGRMCHSGTQNLQFKTHAPHGRIRCQCFVGSCCKLSTLSCASIQFSTQPMWQT